jgi:hypothetical protein
MGEVSSTIGVATAIPTMAAIATPISIFVLIFIEIPLVI